MSNLLTMHVPITYSHMGANANKFVLVLLDLS